MLPCPPRIALQDLNRHYGVTAEINDIVGNGRGQATPPQLLKQVDLINDEAEELMDLGFRDRNLHELRDGICDVLFTAYGLLHRANLWSANQSFLIAESTISHHTAIGLYSVEFDIGAVGICQAQVRVLRDQLDDIYTILQQNHIHDVGAVVARRTIEVIAIAYALGDALELPVSEDYDAVCASNMTKFDETEELALQTQQKYAAIGVETVIVTSDVTGKTLYINKSAHDQVGDDEKKYAGGKFLKSVNFAEPVYREIDFTF